MRRFPKIQISLVCMILVILSPFVSAAEISHNLNYDENGNLINDNKYNYEYNSPNQLVKISDDNGVIAEYFYDHNDNRIKKIEFFEDGTNSTTYYIDDNFVTVINSSGVYNTIYYYQGGVLVGKKDYSGEKYFYHPDHLGSTNIVTNEVGETVEETDYLPFGEVLLGGESRYLFTGQEKDKGTSLMYYGARYYSPFLRRFTQPDTIIQDVYDPQTLNRYAYVRNNPVNRVDPSGHWIHIPIGFVIGFGVNLIKQILVNDRSLFGGTIDWLEATAWGVGGGAAAATFGIGPAIAGTGYGGVALGGGIAGFTGGRYTQLSYNLMKKNRGWNDDLLDPKGIALETAFGATLAVGGKFVGSMFSGKGPKASFRSSALRESHFNGKNGHGIEMGYKNSLTYERDAAKFLTGTPQPKTAEMIRPFDQALVRYQFGTGNMGVLDADGTTIRTFLKPYHGNPIKGYEYYLRQINWVKK